MKITKESSKRMTAAKQAKAAKLKVTKSSRLPPLTQICVSSDVTGNADSLYGLDTDGRVWVNSWAAADNKWIGWALVPDEIFPRTAEPG